MKKLLLSALCMLGVISMASATEATIVFNDDLGVTSGSVMPDQSLNNGDVTLSFNGCKYYNTAGTNLRCYANNTITVTAGTGLVITEIAFTCTETYSINASSNATVGTLDVTNAVWTGKENKVVINIAGAQVRFDQITVTYTTGVSDTPTSTIVGNGTKENPYTVADILNGATASGKVWSKGYIVGYTENKSGASLANDTHFTTEGAANTNIVIAGSDDVASAEDGIVGVQLPSGTVRNALNLASNPQLLGAEVLLYGTLEKYFGAPGIKSVSDYELVGVEVVIPEYATLAQWLAAKPTTAAQVNAPATVVYQNGQYMWITSGGTNMLVYGSLSKKYNNGDVIPAGYQGSYSLYNGLTEFLPVDATFAAATAGTPIEPEEVACEELATDMVHTYIKIENATIALVSGSNYTLNDGTMEVALYNQFASTVNIPEGTNLTVIGFLSYRNDAFQIIPVSVTTAAGLEKVAEPVFSLKSGAVYAGSILSITCATKVAAIHYTLDGTVPTAASPLYTEPIVINEAVTVKAIAIVEGMEDSEIVEVAFTVKAVGEVEGDSATFDWSDPASLSPATEAPVASVGVNIGGVTYYSNGTSFVAVVPEGLTDTRLWLNKEVVELRTYGKADTGYTALTFTSLCGRNIASIEILGGAASTTYIGCTEGTIENLKNETNKIIGSLWTAPEGGVETISLSCIKNAQISSFTVNYVVASAPAGDINGDGEVDSSDLAALINLITGIAEGEADLNGDGETDSSDLAALINLITGI